MIYAVVYYVAQFYGFSLISLLMQTRYHITEYAVLNLESRRIRNNKFLPCIIKYMRPWYLLRLGSLDRLSILQAPSNMYSRKKFIIQDPVSRKRRANPRNTCTKIQHNGFSRLYQTKVAHFVVKVQT